MLHPQRQRSEIVSARRQFIFRRVVLENQPLSLAELRERLGQDPIPASDKDAARRDLAAANRDVEAFCDVGCPIKIRDSAKSRGKEFVFLEGLHTDEESIREDLNPGGKALVARLTASMICGFSKSRETGLLPTWINDPNTKKALDRLALRTEGDNRIAARVRALLMQLQDKANPGGMDSAQTVLSLLEESHTVHQKNQEDIRRKLLGFWREANRLVALDSGTTNKAVARYLKDLFLPMPGSPLCSLSVCTNSRTIFEILGPSNVSVKTIIIGGQQKFHSPTIAGAMAELFLRTSAILQFGMCILGATKIDMERFALCSDSQEEATIKTLFMEKSSLRIICVDDTKLQSGLGREGYKFAAVDPQHIDLVITNSPLREDVSPEGVSLDYFRAFAAKVGAIEGRGIPVLVATSADTFGHPSEGFERTPKKKPAVPKAAQPAPTSADQSSAPNV
jgi:DeoR/GlpR family transcriptional regulator of sugar metabolism